MDYLHLFETQSEYNTARENNYLEPWVSATNLGEDYRVDFNKTKEEKLLSTPLTFEITSDGVIKWSAGSNNTDKKTIQYSKNGGEWTSITSATGASAPSISVVAGDEVRFRGNNAAYYSNGFNKFSETTCGFKLKGNIMSLINSTDFASLTTLNGGYAFYSLFNKCANLTDASELVLPATTLTEYCYACMFQYCPSLTVGPSSIGSSETVMAASACTQMFKGCSGLTTTPELPATTVAPYCYDSMFYGCSGLTTAPSILPATTVAIGCYSNMFYYCTSLTAAPELPATTLANYCYNQMFYGCSGLTAAPELPATTIASGCYQHMFNRCTSLTTAPSILPATTLAGACYNGMFINCTSLTTAPELPATTLAGSCYNTMFMDCHSLNYVKCLATNISAGQCTNNWLSYVSTSGTFVKNPSMSSWTTGTSGIPTNWTVQDA